MDSTSFFFSDIDKDYFEDELIKNLDKYSNNNYQHIYLINRPLSEKKYNYTVNKVLIFLSPGYNINFININLGKNDFEEIYLDFIEDLGHIADKYNYTDIISRPRKWKKFIVKNSIEKFRQEVSDDDNIKSFLDNNELESDIEKRTVKLLISLLTGSINSVEKIGGKVPESRLEKVKRNIILFDGDQTRFIFEENYQNKVVKIQGLAGTGKTELLLHRLKEIYVSNKDSKIVFTCQSKTLANRLKTRITDFFNFMKVEEQIDWNERLWVMHGWGSVRDINNLGTYGMICRIYKLPFYTAANGSFAVACKKTLDYLTENNIKLDPIFDYMLIDEGQDFTDEFIELCSKVTKNRVFVAGDIFQDIFGVQNVEAKPNYLLNKCYRTDPRTLMFSHALGLALYEKPALRFLKDEEWTACGYSFEVDNGMYKLKREPVKRFEDIDPLKSPSSMKIIDYDEYNTLDIIKIIKDIKSNYSDVKADDIAVVFPSEHLDYSKIDRLETAIYNEFNLNVNVLHNTKEICPNKITISNKNNIKGLEFPFIICIADYVVTRELPIRNTLYMTLTRSFLESYLLIQKYGNEKLISIAKRGLEEINKSLMMVVKEPTKEEREHQEQVIKQYNTTTVNQYDVLNKIFDDLKISKLERPSLKRTVSMYRPNELDEDKLKQFISTLKGFENE